MKAEGVIKDFNNKYGKIVSVDGIEYLLLDKNTVGVGLYPGTLVEFESDMVEVLGEQMPIARFVKVLRYQDNHDKENKN